MHSGTGTCCQSSSHLPLTTLNKPPGSSRLGLIPNFPHVVVMNCLKCNFWLLETSQLGNGAAAMEEREEHEGLARKQPTLGDGKSRAEKIIHNLVGKCIHAFQPFCSPFAGT